MTTRGQRIQKIRTDNALSQEAFANILGVSRQSVSKWEADKALPEIDKLEMISARFGFSTDWIITGHEFVCELEETKIANGILIKKSTLITLLISLLVFFSSTLGLAAYILMFT